MGAGTPLYTDYLLFGMRGSHYSGYAQLRWTPLASFELSAGGRYSHESKRLDTFTAINLPEPGARSRDWDNFSPEITAAWRPSSELTVFASRKKGFLSGGFTIYGDPYGQQTTVGYEVGVKALLADERLRLDFSAYSYRVKGLQVSLVNGLQTNIVNAGKSSVRGLEADANWQTPVRGLSVQTALGYNRARYDVFNTNCYIGQPIERGCDLALGAGGAYTLQDLRTRPLSHAPDFTSTHSLIYERPVAGGYRLELSVDAAYTSSYYTDTLDTPFGQMGGYWLLDSGVRLRELKHSWELDLLGRNLANKFYYISSGQANFTGDGSGTRGALLPADQTASISRGREVMIRVSKEF